MWHQLMLILSTVETKKEVKVMMLLLWQCRRHQHRHITSMNNDVLAEGGTDVFAVRIERTATKSSELADDFVLA